jgi:hypothetical protein
MKSFNWRKLIWDVVDTFFYASELYFRMLVMFSTFLVVLKFTDANINLFTWIFGFGFATYPLAKKFLKRYRIKEEEDEA